ncbi:uncharacterized protein WCC33_009258 [Rhinophrynus dorsalis]
MPRIYSLFFQLLWGNRLNLIRRDVTYLSRHEGGLDMVNPMVFFVNTFLSKLYVRGNIKYKNINDRGCSREGCSSRVETMDHFLLECPFNIEVYKRVSNALGIPCLSGGGAQYFG